MIAEAFCPAHVTGFFSIKRGERIEDTGSLGAGFSIRLGISTRIQIDAGTKRGRMITVSGYPCPDTLVSERILDEYEGRFQTGFVRIHHEITAPVGYGLGCSAAAALSLSMALNAALGSPLTKEQAAGIAHKVEVECRTGLGDVLAAYHGGFEMRLGAGAPGVGRVEKIENNLCAVIACFAPISTEKFISEKTDIINGLGCDMLSKLVKSPQPFVDFQDMSMEFSRSIGITTSKTEEATDMLHRMGVRCGIALFGQTVFTLVDPAHQEKVAKALESLGECTVIKSRIDKEGARLQVAAPVIPSG